MKQTDNAKQWEVISRRSLRGGIISRDHLTVSEKDNLVIIKAGIGKVLRRLAMFFLFGILVVGLMLYSWTKSPSTPEGADAVCGSLLFMVIVVSACEIVAFFRGGRVDLNRNSGTVSIRHGLFFRKRRKVSVCRDDLEVRLYQNRQGVRGREIPWGNLVLSLKRVDIDGEELVLCKARTVKHLREPFEAICEFLGRGEMVDIDDFIQKETSKQPLTADPAWNSLAIRSRTQSPLLGRLQPGMSKRGNEFHVSHSLFTKLIWFGCVIMGILTLATLFVRMSVSSLFAQSMLLVGILLFSMVCFIAIAYCVLCRAERVSIYPLLSKIRIHYGITGFGMSMEYPLSQIEIKFYRSGPENTCACVKTGDTVLSIVHKNAPKDELVIYSSTDADYMRSLYDAINQVLGKPVEDGTEDNFEMPDGKVIKVARTSLNQWDKNLCIKRKLLQPNPEQILMKRKMPWKFAVPVFLAVPVVSGIMIAIIADLLPEGPLANLFFIGISGVICFGGLFGVCYVVRRYWRQLYLVADKNERQVYYQLCRGGGKTNVICEFEEIGAVQVCMSHQSDPDENKGNPFAIFEINLVVPEPDVRRILVSAGEKEDQIRMDAEKFAEFLDVPLLDHI